MSSNPNVIILSSDSSSSDSTDDWGWRSSNPSPLPMVSPFLFTSSDEEELPPPPTQHPAVRMEQAALRDLPPTDTPLLPAADIPQPPAADTPHCSSSSRKKTRYINPPLPEGRSVVIGLPSPTMRGSFVKDKEKGKVKDVVGKGKGKMD